MFEGDKAHTLDMKMGRMEIIIESCINCESCKARFEGLPGLNRRIEGIRRSIVKIFSEGHVDAGSELALMVAMTPSRQAEPADETKGEKREEGARAGR